MAELHVIGTAYGTVEKNRTLQSLRSNRKSDDPESVMYIEDDDQTRSFIFDVCEPRYYLLRVLPYIFVYMHKIVLNVGLIFPFD